MKPNVLLISLDTLRADVAYSGRFPNLERLRRGGTWFRSAVSSVPLTPPSHATILTGLQPARNRIRHLLRETLDPDVPTLATLLRDAGYATGAVVSCPGLNQWYGMSRGFGHYDDEVPRLPDGRDPLLLNDVKLRGTALKRAAMVTDRALAWLAESPQEPWFLFVHYFDSHWPYEPPDTYGVEVANPYEGEVAYMDHHVGRLLDGLADRGIAIDETLVVCLSDHGEDLAGWYRNDHAGEKGHPEEEGHGCLLFDATQHVPLWIRWPGRVPQARPVDAQVRLVDVMPTILDLLGLPVPEVDGGSLVPYVEGRESAHRAAYSETFFREELAISQPRFQGLRPWKALRIGDRYKVIWEVGGTGGTWWYDLREDPGEERPIGPNGWALCEEALARARQSLEVQPAMRAAFDELVPWLESAAGFGVAIAGSFAHGTADRYSNLDLRLGVAGRSPDIHDARWVHESLSSVGRVLTFYPAAHPGAPERWSYLLERDGAILAIDVDLRRFDTASENGDLVLRRPAEPVSPAVPVLSFASRRDRGDEHALRSRQFAGLVWHTYTRIARGDLDQAAESLGSLRRLGRLPGQPVSEGAGRKELMRALEATIGAVQELPPGADLVAIAAAIRAAESPVRTRR